MPEAAAKRVSPDAPPLILASASRARLAILRGAGLRLEAMPAPIDEEAAKESLRAEGADAESLAAALAELKAVAVSSRHADALVIGGDQVLELDGTLFDKPPDRPAAREQLLALRGRTHRLVSAAVLARGGARIWHAADSVHLTMRDFSEDFLDAYLDAAGESVCESVGAYRLEGTGVQLFDRIEGDYFTVLGLPLLPLLEVLRTQGVVVR
ncbi:MAG: septum formation protein Maf [Rhodospirillaceae bacterium]|nr:septum formation protein Maf [Rhodospirillaceae bacterium]MBT5412965.1 septum formation protein Maf [Rhodospirillaceae bacterium]MBT6117332.1 septum formation protein Maf [Rhodospirillaceae bacterium]